ncbi:MAG: O-methyltransferase [Fimbriimonadales bacterium]|nr:O-methyltransferase [Fimbriimonadales bacterium]
MELYHPQLVSYLESLVPERHPVLQEMERRAAETGFPIVGPVVGQLLYLLTRLTGARRVFELGSGFGYSTAWFALGVRDNGGGEVYHVVWDESLSRDARDYLSRLGLVELVRFHVSEAVAQLQQTDGQFDLIFNDINKEQYPDSLAAIKPKLRSGGVLIVDNALWHGAIFDESDRSPATEGVRTLTRLLTSDPDFVCSLIPLRDGVLLAQKR